MNCLLERGKACFFYKDIPYMPQNGIVYPLNRLVGAGLLIPGIQVDFYCRIKWVEGSGFCFQ